MHRHLPRLVNALLCFAGATPASLRSSQHDPVTTEENPDRVGTEVAGTFLLMKVLALRLLHGALQQHLITAALILFPKLILGLCGAGLGPPQGKVLSPPSAQYDTQL